MARLKTDYAYWAASCVTIKDRAGQYVRFVMNEVQRRIEAAENAMLAEKGSALLYILKARRPGVSTHEQLKNLHLIWRKKGANALTLADTGPHTDQIFDTTRRAIEYFPRELLPELSDERAKEIHFTKRDSHFWTDTAGSARAGQGVDLWRLHLSEFAHFTDPDAVWRSSGPSLVPGSVATIETTGGGFDTPAHNFWRDAVKGGNGFRTLFFPWWECSATYAVPLLAPDELGTLSDAEQDLVDQHGLTLEQVKWRREQVGKFGLAGFLQEYPEDDATCWLTSGTPYFDFATIKALMGEPATPLSTDRNGELEIYNPTLVEGLPWPTEEGVIIGVDPAEGVGGDRSAFEARAFPSWKLLVTFASRNTSPEEFAGLIDWWGRRLNGAYLVVERNTITTLRRLLDHHGYPPERVYHRPRFGSAAAEPTKNVGWLTSKDTVPLMGDAAREMLQAAYERRLAPANDKGEGVFTMACLRDAAAVQRNDRGVPEFSGKDTLVASLLCWMGRSEYPASVEAAPMSIEQAQPFTAIGGTGGRHWTESDV